MLLIKLKKRLEQIWVTKYQLCKRCLKKKVQIELVPAVTIILDVQIRNIIDALSEQNGYEGYPEAISEILFKGIESMIKKWIGER